MVARGWSQVIGWALVLTLALVGTAEAKRFKHYPGDDEDEKPASSEASGPPPKAPLSKSQDRDLLEQGPTSENRESPSDQKDGDKDDDKDDDKKDESPGIFGHFLHGNEALKAEYIYTGEVFTNMHGGMRTRDATRYLGLIDLAITGDLEKLGFAPGGTVFLLGENSHGEGLSRRFVGDWQWLSNIDPYYPFTQVTEYWWERKLWDDQFTIRLGKQDANKDFGVVGLGGDFINSSFGLAPNILMPTWPYTAMGVTTLWQVTEPLTLKLGIYDGAPRVGNWGFSGTGETFTIGECQRQWKLSQRMPGDFHVGLWYHNGPWGNLQDPTLIHHGDHGVYLGMDQMIWKEAREPEDVQGLGVFFQYSWAPESLNEVPHYFGTGLAYKGLIPGRDDDITGLGLAQVTFSNDLPLRRNETAVELFHKMPLTPHITLEPDLQYIANPDGQYRDAFVFGVRFEAVL